VGKAFGVVFGIGLISLLGVFVALRVPDRFLHDPVALEAAHAPRAIAVSVPKLCADYQADEEGADNLYNGKRLFVEGQVANSNGGSIDGEFVSLSTFGEFEAVHAYIKAEYRPEAAKLRTGQILTLDCEGAGMVMGNRFLMNCSFSSPTERHVTVPTLISTVPAAYSAEARKNKLQGPVEIQLLVDENGNPRNVEVVHSLGMGLDESAVEAVKHYKFKPAVDESTGKVVTARMNISLQFHLN